MVKKSFLKFVLHGCLNSFIPSIEIIENYTFRDLKNMSYDELESLGELYS